MPPDEDVVENMIGKPPFPPPPVLKGGNASDVKERKGLGTGLGLGFGLSISSTKLSLQLGHKRSEDDEGVIVTVRLQV